MLKRNWNWRNNRLFCHIFVIGEISIEGLLPALPPLDYACAPSEENKKGVHKFSARFLAFSNEISTVQKIVLSSSRGQGSFRGLEASRPRPKTWPSRPRPRNSKCVLEDVLEAKDVLEDPNSDQNMPKIMLFLPKKYKMFESWGLPPPQIPEIALIADFWLHACHSKPYFICHGIVLKI